MLLAVLFSVLVWHVGQRPQKVISASSMAKAPGRLDPADKTDMGERGEYVVHGLHGHLPALTADPSTHGVGRQMALAP
jgi:hypothetical protein